MKLDEWDKKLNRDPEYRKAVAALKPSEEAVDAASSMILVALPKEVIRTALAAAYLIDCPREAGAVSEAMVDALTDEDCQSIVDEAISDLEIYAFRGELKARLKSAVKRSEGGKDG